MIIVVSFGYYVYIGIVVYVYSIYESRNKQLALNVIDLHGLHIDEAVGKLNQRVMKIKKMTKNISKRRKKKTNEKSGKGGNDEANANVLDILTGTGHHSFRGRAKLGPAIVSWAKQKNIKYKNMNFIDGRGGNIRIFIE